jgi:hypothetical protein
MSLDKFAKDLKKFGFETKVNKQTLEIDFNEIQFFIEIEDDWLKSINKVYKAKQYELNHESKFQVSNRQIEFQVFKLSPSYFSRVKHEFKDEEDNSVVVSEMTKEYQLNLFKSDEFIVDNRVLARIKRRHEGRSDRFRQRQPRFRMRLDDLLINFQTITYTSSKTIARDELIKIGREKCKASLFKLALTENQCWELRETIKVKGFQIPQSDFEELDTSIPKVQYDDDLVVFYKIAKSSLFPSQSFLSFYHVLEYNFLRVADEELFSKTKSIINNPTFNSSYDNVNKLLSVLKKHDKNLDETSMLRRVIEKFIDEEELINYIKDIETSINDKPYSKPKDPIFGERIPIKLEIGHSIANVARVIKHIRNSLVHSSDKYNREECFIPFSESESIVIKYNPIINFLAEKVIFAQGK